MSEVRGSNGASHRRAGRNTGGQFWVCTHSLGVAEVEAAGGASQLVCTAAASLRRRRSDART